MSLGTRRPSMIPPVLAAAILALALGCEAATAAPPPPGLKVHRSQAGEPGRDGWYLAESTEGHFRVKTPIPFNDYTVEGTGKDGRKFGVHCIGCESVEKVKFAVTELGDLPREKKPADMVREMTNGLRKGGKTLSEERVFERGNQTISQFRIATARSSAAMRYVVAEGRLFMQIVEFPPSSGKVAEPLLPQFFDSLEVEGEKPAAAK